MRASLRLAGLLLAPLLLAACEPAEKRAEAHYQRALALLAAGDPDRAAVEFRNVFHLDGDHDAARLAYARLLEGRGDLRPALAQYLRLAEQAPENLEGQRETARLALRLGDGETARFHAAQALALAPGDPEMRALRATLDWRRGGPERAAAVAEAAVVIAEAPATVAAQVLLVSDRLAAGDPAGALARADAALKILPGEERLHLARLAALNRLGDAGQDADIEARIGAELQDMVGRFPENAAVRRTLVAWHLAKGDPAGALAVLRAAAGVRPADPGPALALAAALRAIEGPAAARAELEARIAAATAAGADPRPYQQARAGLDFAEGRAAEAIAALRALLAGAEASDATRDLQVALAGMLAATGADGEGAGLLDTVLAADPGHGGALKLRAQAAIAGDRPDAAIADLRTAQGQAPEDPEVQTLLALAQERAGSRALMGEALARAVELSGGAPAEAGRYASFLMQEGRPGPAAEVADTALRRAPGNPELLALAGRIRLAAGNPEAALQAAAELRAAGEGASADALEARILGESRISGRQLARLERLAAAGTAPAMTALVRARVAAGEAAAAAAWLDARLQADPADVPARQLRAELLIREGAGAAAEALLTAGLPEVGDAEAGDAGDGGVSGNPAEESRTDPLRRLRAGLREGRGDAAGAIADYETLHARAGGEDPAVANNLAALLAARGEAGDPAALDRAFAVARRLQGSPVPQFRDTIGWILVLRGDAAGAIAELEPAAAALPGEGTVQFHRAEALLALGRTEAAREGFGRALAAGLPEPLAARARGRLAETASPTPG